DRTLRLWDVERGETIRILEGHESSVRAVVWSPDGQSIASSSRDRMVCIWGAESGRQQVVLEGHTSVVTSIAFLDAGRLLASLGEDSRLILWRTDNWAEVMQVDGIGNIDSLSNLAVHPTLPVMAVRGIPSKEINVWAIDFPLLRSAEAATSTVFYVNAKAVLLGDSGVGKSGLGIRIAEQEFRKTDSTHGAQFWHFAAEQLPALPAHIRAELTLWDLAGQPEYRLTHQLFLDDADAALLLFDCSDANDPFRGVPYWAKVLKKHAPDHGKRFLVSSRSDVSPVTVGPREINYFLGKHRLDEYFRTSANTGEGVDELFQRLMRAIPWEELPRTSTPRLFQVVREFLLEQKQLITALAVSHRPIKANAQPSKADSHPSNVNLQSVDVSQQLSDAGLQSSNVRLQSTDGKEQSASVNQQSIHADSRERPECLEYSEKGRKHEEAGQRSISGGLLSMAVLRQAIKQRFTERAATQAELDTVVQLLQSRGLVHRLDPRPGETWILLRPERINQYGASIIQAARNHPAGIGAVTERDVLTGNIPFTGFARLARDEEAIVLEATAELLLGHDLGFREMGYLIFPSQINVTRIPSTEKHPRTEVAYRFSGAIETIYASLVVRLSYTEHFRREDQWKYAVEFSRDGHRLGFSMRQVEEGTGEIEIYFQDGVNEFDRVTFIRFITDHLRARGVDIQEQIRLYCPNCDREVTNREAIEARVRAGKLDIPCQFCDTAVVIPESVEEHYRRDPALGEKQQELAGTV
ncbi:MAG: hypothetical protein KJO08_02930, partial [Gammaproteobacteria bacterium]|nr:hypothetical protein [Gammaproteobacteria bacterium]